MNSALDCITLPSDESFAETMVLAPVVDAPAIVLPLTMWRRGLRLAALHGWNPRRVEGNLLYAAGQHLEPRVLGEIADGLRRALQAIESGDMDPEELFDGRGTCLDPSQKLGFGRHYVDAPHALLVRQLRFAVPGTARTLPDFAGLYALADVLAASDGLTLSPELPADFLDPAIPTTRVEVLAHPGGAGACYTLRGRARAAGERIAIPDETVRYAAAAGIVRVLTPEELAAELSPIAAPATAGEPARKGLAAFFGLGRKVAA